MVVITSYGGVHMVTDRVIVDSSSARQWVSPKVEADRSVRFSGARFVEL